MKPQYQPGFQVTFESTPEGVAKFCSETPSEKHYLACTHSSYVVQSFTWQYGKSWWLVDWCMPFIFKDGVFDEARWLACMTGMVTGKNYVWYTEKKKLWERQRVCQYLDILWPGSGRTELGAVQKLTFLPPGLRQKSLDACLQVTEVCYESWPFGQTWADEFGIWDGAQDLNMSFWINYDTPTIWNGGGPPIFLP